MNINAEDWQKMCTKLEELYNYLKNGHSIEYLCLDNYNYTEQILTETRNCINNLL